MDPITFLSLPRAGDAIHADNILAADSVSAALVCCGEGHPQRTDPLLYEGAPVYRVALRVKAEFGAYVHWLYAVRRSPSLYTVLPEPKLYVQFDWPGEVRND